MSSVAMQACMNPEECCVYTPVLSLIQFKFMYELLSQKYNWSPKHPRQFRQGIFHLEQSPGASEGPRLLSVPTWKREQLSPVAPLLVRALMLQVQGCTVGDHLTHSLTGEHRASGYEPKMAAVRVEETPCKHTRQWRCSSHSPLSSCQSTVFSQT